jgi:hypothetical protein
VLDRRSRDGWRDQQQHRARKQAGAHVREAARR